MGPDPQLRPADALVALRSLPRRFTEAFAVADTDRYAPPGAPGEEVARPYRADAEGWTPLGHLVAAAHAVSLATAALDAIWHSDHAEVTRAAVDVARRVRDPAPAGLVADRCAELAWEVDALADVAGERHGPEWVRTGTVEGTGETVRAVDVLQLAVADCVDHLTRARAALGGTSAGPRD